MRKIIGYICAVLIVNGTTFAANPTYTITSVSHRFGDKFNAMEGLCFDLKVQVDNYKDKEILICGELCSKNDAGNWVEVPVTGQPTNGYVCSGNIVMAKAKSKLSCTNSSTSHSKYEVFLPYNIITHPRGDVYYKIRFWMRDANEKGVFVRNINGSYYHEYSFSLNWPTADDGGRYEIKSVSHRFGDKFNDKEGLCFDLNLQVDNYKDKEILIYGKLCSKDNAGNWVEVPVTGQHTKGFVCSENTVMAKAKSRLSCTNSSTSHSKYEVFLPYNIITHPSGAVYYKILFWMDNANEEGVFVRNMKGGYYHEYTFSLKWPTDNSTQSSNEVSHTSTQKTTSSSSQFKRSTCTIISPANNSTYKSPSISLCYIVNADNNSNYSVKFYVAGKEVKPLNLSLQKGAQLSQGTEVELPMPQEAGRETVVAIQIVDANGIIWDQKSITLNYINEHKPTLHVFAVGISEYPVSDLLDLKYGAKDAQDFVNAIKSLDLSRYKEVKQTLILNKEASANYIRTQLNKLVNRVDQEDVVMLFFSGHGINEDDKWYFMTYGIPANDCVNALDFAFIKEQMKKMSKDKNCHVLIFMDACHSGGMYGQKGYVKDITLSEAGINGFYSSAASKKSREENGNGLFTRALIDGIKGAADIDNGGSITISELREYINKTLKDKGQSPVFDNPGGDYVIFYKKK